MVITAMRVPDHSTIAEFRKRHERALAALFGDVLGMCARARLVKVGVIAIDGRKISANASMDANRGSRANCWRRSMRLTGERMRCMGRRVVMRRPVSTLRVG